ncbi:MAG: glycosyltransferase family 39 protein [Candidatus Hydrogenedentes bacterium]|nr:glycosyltransferase family 39 protein [Candidatus Hydrogenedentota bacterium]
MLLALALVTVFYALGRADVITDNEGQRATPPAEMVRSGNYLIPTINGVDYLVKPPLLYWAIAGLYNLTGTISPFIARIPTALCGALLVIAAYLAFRREAGEQTARWAAFLLLASPYALERMRWAELDIPLTLAVFLCVAAFRTAVLRESGRERALWTLGAGLAFGAAIMLKGPVPFLFLWVAAVAQLITQGQNAGRVVRTGLLWSIVALAVEMATQAAAALAPAHAKLLGTPVELTAMLLLWTALAWRNGGSVRLRTVGTWLAIMLVGVALSAPWGLAVLYQKGWPYISAMLHNQVVERTYVASRINGGTPFYFLIALPAMLAPWGLLLPLQFSKGQWKAQPSVYHFGTIMGWLSILVFSLIAGKEYEYILPCIPFLLLPTAFHLAAETDSLTQKWVARWLTVWRNVFTILLPVAAIGGAIYLTITEPLPSLLLLVWPLAVLAAVAGALGIVTPRGRTITIFSAALCLILMGLIVRDDRATRETSPRELAQLCGDLVRGGYAVEAAKIYPAFAFYAATPIPVNISPEDIRNKLESDAPFYYLIREKDYEQFLLKGGKIANAKIVAGPYGFKKDMMLAGNAELPE